MRSNRTDLVRMPNDFRQYLDLYKYNLQARLGQRVTYPFALSKLLVALKVRKDPFDFDL